ncbi:MAG: hypothetical protein ABFS86_04295 [Planctomycetota bacterium]
MEVRVSGPWFVTTDWIPVDLQGGGPVELAVNLVLSRKVTCAFGRPFSGVLVLYGRTGDRWTEIARSTVRNPVSRFLFTRSEISGDTFRVLAYPVEGGVIRDEGRGGSETHEVTVPVLEHGAGRIVVRSDDASSLRLQRLALEGWESVGTGRVKRLGGARPSGWKLGDLSAGPAGVFGGLLPGMYRVLGASGKTVDPDRIDLRKAASATVVVDR